MLAVKSSFIYFLLTLIQLIYHTCLHFESVLLCAHIKAPHTGIIALRNYEIV